MESLGTFKQNLEEDKESSEGGVFEDHKESVPESSQIQSSHYQSKRVITTGKYVTHIAEQRPISDDPEDYNKKIQTLTEGLEKLEAENSKLRIENGNIKNELRNVKLSTSKLQHNNLRGQYQKEIDEIKAENAKEIKEFKEESKNALTQLEAHQNAELVLERKEHDEERKTIEDIYKKEIEDLEDQHKLDINLVRKQLGAGNSLSRSQLQRNQEFSVIINRADSLTIAMRTKLEEEMKDKIKSLDEREAALENLKRKLVFDKDRLETEKQRTESTYRIYKDKEKHMKKELEDCKKIYDFKNNLLEAQHQQEVKDLADKREYLTLEKKKLDMEMVQLSKLEREQQVQANQEQASLLLEKKLVKKKKNEFASTKKEDSEIMRAKKAEFEAKREEIFKQESELLKRQQLLTAREMELHREYDELQNMIDKHCYDQREFDLEKQRIEVLALQVEEESRIIYKYKSTIEGTKQELEQLKADIEAKEAVLRNEKVQVNHAKKDLYMKEQILNTVNKKHEREANLNKALAVLTNKTSKDNLTTTEDITKKLTAKKPPVKTVGAFNANDFINRLERNFGKQNMAEYITGEQNSLFRAKQDMNDRIVQNSLFAHNTDRYRVISKPNVDTTLSSRSYLQGYQEAKKDH